MDIKKESNKKSRYADLARRANMMTEVTLTIPLSQFREFEMHWKSISGQTAWETMYKPGNSKTKIRYGQAFHDFAKLNKITSEPNKTWCDLLYEMDGPYAEQAIWVRMDFDN